jgi:hypothetical protein
MTRQAAGVVDLAGIEPKQMSTGLARMSAILSGKMTLLVFLARFPRWLGKP